MVIRIKNSLVLLLVFTLLTGLVYPLVITGMGHLLFRGRVNGGLITRNGQPAGAELIAQDFHADRFFHPRPSAVNYAPMPSGASNWSPASDTLKKIIRQREDEYRRSCRLPDSVRVPSDMVCASGSGVDPDISAISALQQVPRVAVARQFSCGQESELRRLVARISRKQILGFAGPEIVNVLTLNIELEKMSNP